MTTIDKILEGIEDIEAQGRIIEKIIIPKNIQKKIALGISPYADERWVSKEILDLIEKNGLITLFGHEVEDGDKIQIIKNEAGTLIPTEII